MPKFARLVETSGQQVIYVNPETVSRVRPLDDGAQVFFIDGNSIGVLQNPEQVLDELRIAELI